MKNSNRSFFSLNNSPPPLSSENKSISNSPLQHLPVGLFGSTVALSGLSIAWKTSAALFGAPIMVSKYIGFLGWTVFILLIIGYLYKIIMFPYKVKAELTHPVKANFLGTFFISAVLLSTLAAPYSLLLARISWIIGTFGGIIFVYILTVRLFKGSINSLDLVPPVLIPGLTILNAVTAHASVDLGWESKEMDTILFSVGIMYATVFFIIVTYRLIHREPVTLFLKPTLLIMSAPFEVGLLSYLSTRKEIDTFASALFYSGFFIFIVLLLVVFNKKLPFMVSWWGACFSTVALTNASLQYARFNQLSFNMGIAVILLGIVTIFILITLFQTIRHLFTGKLLTPG